MDPITLALLGGSFGMKLGSALFGVGSERRRRDKLRHDMLANLAPLEAQVNQANFGPSQSEGSLAQSATSSVLSSLADRGVLQSSIAAPAVAAAVAPIEQQRQARRQGLIERLTAAKNAIYGDTSMPGYGSAFADTLGQGGDVLALLAGRQMQGGGMDPYSPEALNQHLNDPSRTDGLDASALFNRKKKPQPYGGF